MISPASAAASVIRRIIPYRISAADPLLDIAAIATRLGVSTKMVRRLIEREELAVHCIGRLLRVSETDIHNYVSRQRKQIWVRGP
jgi:excisionase family DNA binding protein